MLIESRSKVEYCVNVQDDFEGEDERVELIAEEVLRIPIKREAVVQR